MIIDHIIDGLITLLSFAIMLLIVAVIGGIALLIVYGLWHIPGVGPILGFTAAIIFFAWFIGMVNDY